MPEPMTVPPSGVVDAWQAALAAEHAAVFGYGTLGPHLPPARVDQARVFERAHRGLRDTVIAQMGDVGISTTKETMTDCAGLTQYKRYASYRYTTPERPNPERNVMLVVFTDEAGSDTNRSEETIKLCRRLAIRRGHRRRAGSAGDRAARLRRRRPHRERRPRDAVA